MKVQHEAERRRFIARLEEGEAELSYAKPDERTLDLQHTFVPPPARGEGVGEALVEHALDHARQNGYRIIPSCPFVHEWLGEHPEYGDLVAGP